ncbi:GIY-YIG nuclease family protein [Candidatus Wolfebacteria bacterium]|nr:GIY-YIG nuclease family protein [Candidatus Wolfebacteria bacterium]
MYFVYLVLCKDKSIYTGITNNLKRRLKQHQSQKAGSYTRSHKAVKILHTEQFPTKSQALRREAEIKSWRREKKLKLIKFGKSIL